MEDEMIKLSEAVDKVARFLQESFGDDDLETCIEIAESILGKEV